MKRTSIIKNSLLVAVLALVSLGSSAHAAPITIGNFSFETAIEANGTGVGNWTSDGSFGIFQFGAPYATQGSFAAYTNTSGTSMYQRLGPIQEGNYTFMADIGSTQASPNTAFFDIYAYDGGLDQYFLLGNSGPITPPAMSVLTNQTVSFSVPNASANIGRTLQLQFVGSGVQSSFDNVRGDFTAVPEPSTTALVFGAAILLACVVRRRKVA